MSVTMRSHCCSPPSAIKSSADPKPRAPYPSEQSESTSAERNEGSSSMTAIASSFGIDHSFGAGWPADKLGGGHQSHAATHQGSMRVYDRDITGIAFSSEVGSGSHEEN